MKQIRFKGTGLYFFIFTIIVTFAALTFSVYYTFQSFYKVAKADAVSIGEKAIYETAEHLNNFLLNGIDVMTVASQTVEYMMRNKYPHSEIQKYLTNQTNEYRNGVNPNFTGLYGYIDGKFMDGMDWEPDPDYDATTRDWFKGAWWKLGKTTIIPPYVDAQTGSYIISVARMLYDWSVLSLDIQLNELQNFLDVMQSSGNSFIIDRSGLVVAHTDKKQIGRNLREERATSEYSSALCRAIYTRNAEFTKTDRLLLNGENCYVFSQQVQNDWFVVEVVSEAALYQRVKRNLWRNIGISIFILIMVIYFCANALMNRIRSNKLANLLAEHQKSLKETIKVQTATILGQTQEILDFQQSVIEGIAQLIESRDGSTGEHVKNTQKYVLMLVHELRRLDLYPDIIDNKFIEAVGRAATLHDVGKIHIPDNILNKPGRFNDEEYEIMKRHTEYGGEVINTIFKNTNDARLKKIIYDTVKYHHEKWNGMGYPERLAGENIPLCARIMAIADVYDALISPRVYKGSYSYEKAVALMNEEKGKALDPVLLEIFFKLIAR
ncbi:MAG: HD domain-containing protein [Treponema sp.]|nr:HD domain-containing protein [Candidatus Treponema equifaecale]